MRRSRLCLAALAALAIVPASAAAAAPRTFEVVARKGQEARAIAAVHRLRRPCHAAPSAGRCRCGCPRAKLSAVRRSAGVRGAGPVSVGWADTIISQGVYRTGADVLQAEGLRGDGRQDRRARPGLRHALALEARNRAAAGERHRRGPELRSHDGPAGDRRALVVRHADEPRRVGRRGRARHGARRHADAGQLPHGARVRAGRRLARARPRRPSAGRHRRPLEQLPRRPVRRHGRDRARRRRRARRGHPVGQQRRQLRAAGTGRAGPATSTATRSPT